MKKITRLTICAVVILLAATLAFARGAPEEPEPEEAPTVLDDPAAWRGSGVVTLYADIDAYVQQGGEAITEFSESPMLQELVQRGELPPVEERVPAQPLVVAPTDRVGTFGGEFQDPHLGEEDNWEDAFREMPLTFDATLQEVVPNIIRDWEVQDDGHVIEFYLREGMKWSDGHPFTADDFVFYSEDYAWNTDLNPAGIRDMRIAGEMGYFEKVDDYTFRAVFEHMPNASFVERLAWGWRPYYPKHYLSQFHSEYVSRSEIDRLVDEGGYASWVDMFEAKAEKMENPDLPVINAWKLESGRIDDAVQRFVRNPYYWKVDVAGNQLPYVDTGARYNIGDSIEAMVLRAMAGEADFHDAEQLGGVANYAVLRQHEQDGGYRILPMVERGTQAYGAIFFNFSHQNTEFRDLFLERDFRLALSTAMNNPAMNRLFMEGTYHERQGYAPPAGSPFNGERAIFAEGMNYDLDAANELLDGLGLEWNSARTRRVTDGGEELRFTFLVRPRDPNFVPIAEMIKEDWAEIGVDITIRPVGGGTWGELTESRQHDIAMDQWGLGGARYPDIPVFRDLAPRDDGWKAEPQWGLWAITGGELGVEPPEPHRSNMLRLMELQAEGLAAPTRADRQAAEREMFDWHAEHMYWLTALNRPADHAQSNWFYFHNRVRNVTEPPPRENYYGVPSQWYLDR